MPPPSRTILDAHAVGNRLLSVVLLSAQCVVDAVRIGELVFEDDDAAGSLECGARGDEFASTTCQAQLIARVAAMTAFGAAR